MGQSKALLPFGKEVMLTRVVRLMAQVVGPVVVVAAEGQELPSLPDSILVARDRRAQRGPLEGLAAGLALLQTHCEAAFVTSCDVPLLAPALVRRMIQLLNGYEIAVPKDESHYHPLAAVYRTRILGTVQRLLAADRLRPYFLFAEADTREVPVAELREVDPGLNSLMNVNDPLEYAAALKLAGVEPPRE